MGWFFVGLIVCIIIFSNKDMAKEKDKYKEAYYEEKDMSDNDCLVSYLGGFPDVSVKNNNCNLIFFPDKIKMVFKRDYTSISCKEIKNEDILDVSFVTDKYVTDQVNLGALICFGWLGAIAMKNKKQVTKEYIMVTVKDNDKNISVIFNSEYVTNNNEKILNKIKEQMLLRVV